MFLGWIDNKLRHGIAVLLSVIILVVCSAPVLFVNAKDVSSSDKSLTSSQSSQTTTTDSSEKVVSKNTETIVNTKPSVAEMCFVALLCVLILATIIGCGVTCYLIIQKRNLAVAYLKVELEENSFNEQFSEEKEI